VLVRLSDLRKARRRACTFIAHILLAKLYTQTQNPGISARGRSSRRCAEKVGGVRRSLNSKLARAGKRHRRIYFFFSFSFGTLPPMSSSSLRAESELSFTVSIAFLPG